jgi:Tol biopolymer transport system component
MSKPYPVTMNSADNPVLVQQLSPDGRYLVWADSRSINIVTLNSSETRSVTLAADVAPVRLDWYRDGTRLLIGERVKGVPVTMVFSLLSGKMTELRQNAISATVSPDGNRILYADGDYQQLWLMDGNGQAPRRIPVVTESDFLFPMFWSPGGKRIWFVRVHSNKDKSPITLETCDLLGGNRTVVLSDSSASAFILLPGRIIYSEFEREHKFSNLWELAVDAAGGKPEASPRKLTNWTNFSVAQLSATADGKHVAFTNGYWQADVYLGDLRNGGAVLANTRQFTLDQNDDWPSFWTPDDSAVVFESNRHGRSQIFRQRLDRTVPELLSADSSGDQYPKFGGRWIYFYSIPPGGVLVWDKPVPIRRIPIDGGPSVEVLNEVGADVSCADKRPDICVLARLTGKTLSFYHFDHGTGPGSGIGHMAFDSSLSPEFAVSPDGTEIAAIDPSGTGNRIRRIALDNGAISVVELRGRKGVENPVWAADGKSLYASSQATVGVYLLHVNLNGDSQVIFEQPNMGRNTWGVPSHDGKHLAFLQWSAPGSIWMVDDLERGSEKTPGLSVDSNWQTNETR